MENVPLNIPREPTKEWIYYACGWVDDPVRSKWAKAVYPLLSRAVSCPVTLSPEAAVIHNRGINVCNKIKAASLIEGASVVLCGWESWELPVFKLLISSYQRPTRPTVEWRWQDGWIT